MSKKTSIGSTRLKFKREYKSWVQFPGMDFILADTFAGTWSK